MSRLTSLVKLFSLDVMVLYYGYRVKEEREAIYAEVWEHVTFGGVKVPGVIRVNLESWEWVADVID